MSFLPKNATPSNAAPAAPERLAPQEVSVDVLIEKYAKFEEKTAGDAVIGLIRKRVAQGLAAHEPEQARAEWEEKFMWAMDNGFIPAGRINSAGGTDIQATLINCFVQPVGDSVSEDKDGKPSIYKALAQAAETMRRGGGVGYNFSAIRPRGAKVKGTHSQASGPISYMHVFDQSCATVESAGARRGAQMGMMNCDHPDVLDFIKEKSKKGALNNFNVSVAVSDAFMQAVVDGADWELIHKAEPSEDVVAAGAYQRADGMCLPQGRRARHVGGDHGQHLRPRRAGHHFPGPRQQGQQPRILRIHRGDQPLRHRRHAPAHLARHGAHRRAL